MLAIAAAFSYNARKPETRRTTMPPAKKPAKKPARKPAARASNKKPWSEDLTCEIGPYDAEPYALPEGIDFEKHPRGASPA